jgi:serine/threonine-protein kinase
MLIGRVIAGRYRILSKLGEGGMGAVYQAEQISLKRTVAIKLLRPDVAVSPMLLRRFNAEAEAVAKLRHPNTVNIYDFGQDTDGTLFIAMELIEGRSLRSVVHHEAPLPLRRALAIAAQVAASLTDAHAKTIIHRDLKPDNVMLTDRGRAKDNVTVLDFGIAKLRDESRATQQMTQAGDMLGTPQYMAPEQIRGEAIDGRTDVYALGCMIYEMVTARLPYEAPSVMALLSKHLLEQAPPPSQRRPDLGLPPAIDDLVMRAMAKDPAARPPTMEDFGEQIGALLASLPPEVTVQRSAVNASAGFAPVPYAHTPQAYSAAAGFAPTAGPLPGSPTPPPAGGPPTPLPPRLHPPTPPPPGFGPPGPPPHAGAPHGMPYAGPPHGAPPYAHSAPYPMQPGGPPPPQPSPYAHGPAPSAGSSKLIWIVVAVLLLGGGGAGIYFATRGKDASAVASSHDDPRDDSRDDGRDDGGDDPPTPAKPDKLDKGQPDPWERKPDAAVAADDDSDDSDGSDGSDGSDAANVSGKTVDVGQGVKIIAPPGMAVQRVKDGVVIGDLKSFAIVAGPITEKSNDPDVLAGIHAKNNGLLIMSSEVQPVAGAQRKVYLLAGLLNGTGAMQAAVPLIGRGYRVAVIIHMISDAASADPALLKNVDEILTRRIIVPSATH